MEEGAQADAYALSEQGSTVVEFHDTSVSDSMTDLHVYRLIGGPEDGKVVSMPFLVDEITMPNGDKQMLKGAAREASEKKHGHGFGDGVMFHRYRCHAKERIKGVIIMRHVGYTKNPMKDY